ncbi:protein starmaker-like [Battus philenor]|uniref:protein starmaker-like n=1 Tax=Battus philenor TaxID=42288 RepID=UPI0035CF0088
MIITYFLLLFFTHSYCLSIGSTSDKQNVTKREANGDFFPDWVPFKNKHGEELGEFVEVTKKKPKKRLALPANFVLKAQGDQEVDDYGFKAPEEAAGDDYYEKKEWANVVVSDNDNKKLEIDKSDADKSDPVEIAGIDGIVNIITKKEANPFSAEHKASDESEEVERVVNLKETDDDQEDKDDAGNEAKPENKKASKEDEDYEYDEKTPEKENTDKDVKDQSENEAKKAKILDSVDELKQRHADEQRQISEKVKEEEMFKEELERGNLRHPRQEYDKYNNREPEWRKGAADYDEYDEKLLDVRDKYKIITKKSIKTTTKAPEIITENVDVNNNAKQEKISLFANPNVYLIKDYDDSEENPVTDKPKRVTTQKPANSKKFSSRYAESEPQNEDRVRISLVPDEKDSKEGEPTLFFPKKRTGKPRVKTTTVAPDSAESETVQNKNRRTPAVDTTARDSVPSAADIASSLISKDTVTDALPSSTDKKEEAKPENFDFERGRGKEHHASHEEEHSEHGKKAYEGKHEDTKTTKGHHDKEDHIGKYDDHGGIEKEHHDESGHYGHHHHEEHGKKHAKYEESGKHSKGHSTKGSHDIHKKEEYEKNVEFFEEEGDSDEEEKHGGHHDEKSHSEGGHFKKAEHEAGHQGHTKGDKGHFSKGGFGHFDKGHKTSEGHDSHVRHNRAKHHHEGKEGGKKWIYHHGSPPRTANLAIIDRRFDPYRHIPKFYG